MKLFKSPQTLAAEAAEAALAVQARRAKGRKILYGLTPPASLANIGDQAQAVAIHRWFRRHFPEFTVVEVDKDLSGRKLSLLRKTFVSGDAVFLHSGGNLGDRGIWSERGRRNLIGLFPDLPVISLPQTLHFSDTPLGHEERVRSAEIYNAHARLAVLGRDRESARLARELFTRAHVSAAPDFVLSLGPQPRDLRRQKILLCLRNDIEGILSEADRGELEKRLAPTQRYDTTLDVPIPPEQRSAFLDQALELFASHEAVVTDRFHGVIFSVLTSTPCVVLRTVDHKLTSAIEWFEGIGFVQMAASLAEIPAALALARAAPRDPIPDFESQYFAPLAQDLRRRYL